MAYPGFDYDVYCCTNNTHNGNQRHPPAHQVGVNVIFFAIVHPCIVYPGEHHDYLKGNMYKMYFTSSFKL